MSKKTYILDTSALIHDPQMYKALPANSVVIIPIAVLTELDKLKKQSGEVGKNSRYIIRKIDELSAKGNIVAGINTDNLLIKVDNSYIDYSKKPFSELGDQTYGDTQILATALLFARNNKNIVLISDDINLRIKAKSRGIAAEPCPTIKNVMTDIYMGYKTVVNEKAASDLLINGTIDNKYKIDLNLNECVALNDNEGNLLALGRKIAKDKIKLVTKQRPWGISGKSKEQDMAIDLLMDRNIDLVTLLGKSGSGKTLIALAAALELVINKREYDKIIIYRPLQAVSAELGFNPGPLEEKLLPWFQAIMDSFEVLFANNKNQFNSSWKKELEMFQKKDKIEFGAITYARGRSLPNAIIICDEFQNLSKEDTKTILTRAGKNSRVFIVGDIDQIDSRDLDAMNNGIIHTINAFKSSELAGHISLIQGERSRLATKASELL